MATAFLMNEKSKIGKNRLGATVRSSTPMGVAVAKP